ncbi:hypothetical protein N7507_003177 [Penicillium longicatenatum]|nr:hypothetical protein N7507_003177 [Penicillium longicatenatum]
MPLEYNPELDIPDLAGRSIFITGGTGGLGAYSARELAKHNPAHIYISGRSTKSAESIIKQFQNTEASKVTKMTFIECDLSSLSSVQRAAEQFLAQKPSPRLDTLMCNAGIMTRPPATSKDGYEIQFATNHLGHALLIRKLLPLLERTASEGGDGRIIILSSTAWGLHPSGGIQFDRLRTGQSFSFGGPWQRYGQAKLANLLYARELAKRYPHLTCVSVHPGVVETGLFDGMSLKNRIIMYLAFWWVMVQPHEGAYSQLWAATRPKEELVNGCFYLPVGKLGDGGLGRKAKSGKGTLAEKLWDWTQDVLNDFEGC